MPKRISADQVLRPTLLAVAVSAALVPHVAKALDFAQAPPGTVQPYVRPNVIISVDDSGSMDFRLDKESTSGATNEKAPYANGSWPSTSRRMNVLKYALRSVFDPSHPKYDNTLLPDGKIRLAWQVMHNNGGSTDAKSVDSESLKNNSMRPLEGEHRTNFISFVNSLDASGGTPSHTMFSQADAYLRRPPSKSGPWSGNPGGNDTAASTYLGCRRNYHIFMTDGRWNGTASGGHQDCAAPYSNCNTDAKGANKTLPDGTVYSSSTAANRPNNELYSDNYANTLADWAFKSWSQRLQPVGALTGDPEPAADYRKAPASESFGNDKDGKLASLERYWNPKYNPADWPHMVTYTIGFSAMAYTWPGAPDIIAPTQMVPFGYDGSFPSLVTGALKWPAMDNENKRSLDLWHAALNGRGRFYAVEKGEDLAKAFRDIFQQINSQTDPDLSSLATSGFSTISGDVGAYVANYEPKNAWKGFVKASVWKQDGTEGFPAEWGGKDTAAKLDAKGASARLILSWSDQWSGSKDKGGVAFKWSNDQSYLSAQQKSWLGLNTNASGVTVKTNGQNVLNYVRGERSYEGAELSGGSGYTAVKPFRQRYSIQGDIVNSEIWYASVPVSNYGQKGYVDFIKNNKNRLPMLYVGGNDGMLHGFSAHDGDEKIAYVPRGVIPTLKLLAEPDFNTKHRYFVDGSPLVGDIDLNSSGLLDSNDSYTPNWKSYLVGTLGAGGKGYFVLDVTSPAAFSESGASNLVVMDRSISAEASARPNCGALTGAQKTACDAAEEENRDIGFITAKPVRSLENPMRSSQVTRMNNNRWAVVLGNGYNSDNQRPVLLIQYLDGDKKLVRIAATTDTQGTGMAKDNGLAAPRVVDINGDDRADIVYAGDNQGNLWKFDLTNENDSLWKVAFAGQPLFSATGPASLGSARTLKQAISAPPIARANNRLKVVGSGTSQTVARVGGMMVAFGTGRNVDVNDQKSTKVETLYSVLDNTRYRTVTGTLGKRLEVHPGGGTCSPIPQDDCAPVPKALGEGVATAKLVKRSFSSTANTAGFQELQKDEALNWASHNGWYLDFPAIGERLLKPTDFYDGSNVLAVFSQVPAKGSDADPDVESCEVISVDDERQYLQFINIMDGAPPSIPIFKSAGAANQTRLAIGKGAYSIINTGKFSGRIVPSTGGGAGAGAGGHDTNRPPVKILRPSWRQLK